MKTNQPLVAKEIRLLMPAYAVALVLAILPVWLLPRHPYSDPTTGSEFFVFCGLWFGMVMLALSSFGREFAMKTFPLLLAQPLERSRTWRNKTVILACATFSVLLVWVLSFVIRYYPDGGSVNDFNVLSHWDEFLSVGVASALVIFASGLCWTILLRQIAAAFWFTILVPVAIIVAHELVGTPAGLDYLMLIAYSVAAFLWARRLFYQAQEVGWTGGTITLSGWRSADAFRARRPLAALFWKEIQLHQVGLAGIGVLFLLHLGVVAVRKLGAHSMSDTTRAGLDVFGGLWLLVPLLIGATSVAEERKLGTMQSHLTLPVSRRVQFLVKLAIVLIVGGLLSALLLWTAEGIGSKIGANCDMELLRPPFDQYSLVVLCLIFTGLSLLCFYASTLVEGLIQAMAVAILAALVAGSLVLLAKWILWAVPNRFGFMLWTQDFLCAIALPTLIVTLIWLAYRNFKNVSVGSRLWWRNLQVYVAVLLGIGVFTSGLYNRVWEYLTPLEPAHGPARLSVSGIRQPILDTTYFQTFPSKLDETKLNALLPDGRIWTGIVGNQPGPGARGSDTRVQTWGISPGQHFLPGSNWASIVSTHRENVAIREDGTLWVSEKPLPGWTDAVEFAGTNQSPGQLVQYGTESNWKSATRWDSPYVILLKGDGTLWLWGPPAETNRTNTTKHPAWLGLASFQPRRLGDQSNWQRIVPLSGITVAWNDSGECWMFYYRGGPVRTNEIQFEPGMVMKRTPALDHVNLQNISQHWFMLVGLADDGSLWGWPEMAVWPEYWSQGPEPLPPIKAVRIGNDSDWTSISSTGNEFVARKADGSLWKWDLARLQFRWNGRSATGVDVAAKTPPQRLSRHDDWLAISSYWNICLAADGSLWAWPDRKDRDYPSRSAIIDALSASSWDLLLSPSRKPSYIGNIFDNQK